MSNKLRTRLAKVLILLLQLTYISAVNLTYEGCMSDSVNSYKVGGWCFLYYFSSSWSDPSPTQTAAQKLCHPYGTLAVGVTYKMQAHFVSGYSNNVTAAWLALMQNSSYTNILQGWAWRVLLPNGNYSTYPAIMSNIPWGPGCAGGTCGEPNLNDPAGVLSIGYGLNNVPDDITAASSLGVICQFAPRTWPYKRRGTGRFNNPTYIVERATCDRQSCVRKCHRSLFCVALAFSQANNTDCQIYGVSPDDSRFSGQLVADSQYELLVRDGMEF